MTTLEQAAEVFPPGDFLREELEARDWTQADLAEIIGASPRLVNEIVAGKRGITPHTAKRLGEALGTSAELWLSLECIYRLDRAEAPDDAIARRANVYAKAPVAEMVRRGWISPSKDIDVMEHQVATFLGIKSIDDDPDLLGIAARAKIAPDGATPAQAAWFCRAQQLATAVDAKPYTDTRLDGALSQLRELLGDADSVRHVPRILADGGVRLVVIEHTKGSRIDGATVWINRKTPLVALTLRLDRIDYFWHTLMHELGHVRMKHAASLDVNLAGPDASQENDTDIEREADRFAVDFLVPQDALEDFIGRVHPMYAKKRILAFAAKHKIHPALVLGQLKHRGKIEWRNMAAMHTKIRGVIVDAALCDGWGQQLPI